MIMPHGKFKGKELSKIPSWMLKWISKNWNDKEIRDHAKEVLDTRSRLGIPEKPKKRDKKTEESLHVPDKVIRKPHNLDMFLGSNANNGAPDLF